MNLTSIRVSLAVVAVVVHAEGVLAPLGVVAIVVVARHLQLHLHKILEKILELKIRFNEPLIEPFLPKSNKSKIQDFSKSNSKSRFMNPESA